MSNSLKHEIWREDSVVSEAMFSENSMLHELDFQDLAISTVAVKAVLDAAKAVMEQFMPGSRPEKLSASQAIALFADRVFWEEDTGKLILCSDYDHRSFCLPIPSDHWHLKSNLGIIQ
jgi:hypothetical protein